MDQNFIDKYEKLVERKLSTEDLLRLQRVQDTLEIKSDDAIWDILIAFDYQKKFYEELPKKIEDSSSHLLENLKQAAAQEAALTQASLADSVAQQAAKLGKSLSLINAIGVIAAALFCALITSAASLWVGYSLGSGQTHPPAILLKMPVGLAMAGGGLGIGSMMLFLAARAFSEGNLIWKKFTLFGGVSLLVGVAILSQTFS